MNNSVIAANKDKFIELLQSTGRKGVDTMIGVLEELGFFSAPASTLFIWPTRAVCSNTPLACAA